MKRVDVFKVINDEREFQEEGVSMSDRPDIIEDLHVGDTILAIQHNLDKAKEVWYSGAAPHQDAMEYLRKVAGLAVQAGEKYGMPSRKRD